MKGQTKYQVRVPGIRPRSIRFPLKKGSLKLYSVFREMFGVRPPWRHWGQEEKRVNARRKANKLARRQRRINRKGSR